MTEDRFRSLSWADLESWVGSRTLSKGRSYKTRVEQLCRTAAGGLIAWVRGSELYATQVSYQDAFVSQCSCPIGNNCKHCVAVVVKYLEQLKHKRDVPLADDSDARFAVFKSPRNDAEAFVSSAQPTGTNWRDQVTDYLSYLDRAELEQLLLNLATQQPEIRDVLKSKAQLSQGVTAELIHDIRRDISKLDQVDWGYDYSRGYRDYQAQPSVDLGELKAQFELLLDAQHYDELVELGHELLQKGTRLVEESQDEGELSDSLRDCVDLVVAALAHSSLSRVEQLIWWIKAELIDQYDLLDLDGWSDDFWPSPTTRADWEDVVVYLRQQLDKMSGQDFSARYKRDRVSNWLWRALEAAGQDEQIIELLEQEAIKTQSYDRLVKVLLEHDRLSDAEYWIHSGIAATEASSPGIARQLRELWVKLREEQNDYPQLAALSAEHYFSSPSLHTFNQLKERAKQLKLWKHIEPLARAFLEHGQRPSLQELQLPDLQLPLQKTQPRGTPPFAQVLLDLALAEQQAEAILRWFDYPKQAQGRSAWGYPSNYDDRVAEAVQESHPERSIAIWRSRAEALIAQTQVSSYQTAGDYLRRLKPLMGEAWRDYILSLRASNRRKPRCVEVLDGLLGHSILGE